MDFWFSGRPWYVYENGKQVDMVREESGVPRFVTDHDKLWKGFIAAFAAIGVGADAINTSQLPSPICARCDEFFEPQRITAKFCLKCRGSYARRKERDPEYAKRNRDAVAKSRAKEKSRRLRDDNQFKERQRLHMEQRGLHRVAKGKK